MRRFIFAFLIMPLCFAAIAQRSAVPAAGGLDLVERRIVRPDQSAFAFYDVLQNGYYNAERQLNYDSLDMAFMGNWPFGASYFLGYAGFANVFMVGSGGAVIFVDAADPYSPEEIALVKSRSLVDKAFYDAGNERLFLGAYFSGVEIWDMSNFETPHRLARIPLESYPRGGIYADGDLLYVVSVADGVYIYDISDMQQIVRLGHYYIPSSSLVWNSAKEGNLIFCPTSQNIRIVDVSDPASPTLAGAVAGGSSDVDVKDGLLYQVSAANGLRIWDISNPASPQLLGQAPLSGFSFRVSVQGGYAFIASASGAPDGGVLIFDVADPSNPSLISHHLGYAAFVGVGQGVAAFSGDGQGYYFLDVSDVEVPSLTAFRPLANWTESIAVKGNLAFTGSNGFRVFDVSDKSNPVQIGYHNTPGALVAVSGNLVVYTPNSMGSQNPVNIMDISDPENPVKRGHYTAPVMTNDIALKDHYAFIACWWNGFRVIDFSNPDNPTLAAHHFSWYNGAEPGVEWCYVEALEVQDNYLYLVDWKPFEDEDTKGLYIFDISDPLNPFLVKRFADINSKANDVAVQGNYAYLADGLGGMEVIDVSNVNEPFIAGYLYTPDGSTAIDVEGNYAYLANYINGGIQVADISFPHNPLNAGFYHPTGVFALGATIAGSYVYVSDGIGGFQIYDNLIITGIDQAGIAGGPDVHLFPNPTQAEVNISFETTQDAYCEVIVLDVTGRVVASIHEGMLLPEKHRFVWDGQQSAVTYMVKVRMDNEVTYSKLIVMK
jgi:hypothetical protein